MRTKLELLAMCLCWAFVLLALGFDVVFTVQNQHEMWLLEENPVQRALLNAGGIWSAVGFRVLTVAVCFGLSLKLNHKNRWLVTRLMVLLHLWIVVSYVAFFWLMEIETQSFFTEFASEIGQ